MPENALINCVNCGSDVDSPYCRNCGQKNPPKKLTFLSLYTDFQNRIYGLDGMFPRTLRDLTIRPGVVARQFIVGNRVKYVGPVGYFFLTLTIFLILLQIFEIDPFELSNRNNPLAQQGGSETQEKISKEFVSFIFRNMRVFSFLQIPITAFFAWLFFRKNRLNFLEHSVLIFYVSGHLAWLSILNIFVYLTFSWNLSMWQIVMNALFFAFACTSFYVGTSKFRIFLKGIMITLLSFLIYMILFLSVGLAYLMSRPDLMEMLKKK